MIKINEARYPEAWRFNSPDCTLKDSEKRRISFLSKIQSKKLWEQEVSKLHTHLMQIPKEKICIDKKIVLNFEEFQSGFEFFKNELDGVSEVNIFWSPEKSCRTDTEIFLKSWSDFFYPSDENTVLLIPDASKKIFSFEESFFCAHFLK